MCVQKQVCACDSHVFNGKRGSVVGQSGWERRGGKGKVRGGGEVEEDEKE